MFGATHPPKYLNIRYIAYKFFKKSGASWFPPIKIVKIGAIRSPL